MRATWMKRTNLLRLILGSMSSRRVRSFTFTFVTYSRRVRSFTFTFVTYSIQQIDTPGFVNEPDRSHGFALYVGVRLAAFLIHWMKSSQARLKGIVKVDDDECRRLEC